MLLTIRKLVLILTGCNSSSDFSSSSAKFSSLDALTPFNCDKKDVNSKTYFECSNFSYSFDSKHKLEVLFGTLDGNIPNGPGTGTIPGTQNSDGFGRI